MMAPSNSLTGKIVLDGVRRKPACPGVGAVEVEAVGLIEQWVGPHVGEARQKLEVASAPIATDPELAPVREVTELFEPREPPARLDPIS
jgi:hypothetical protein